MSASAGDLEPGDEVWVRAVFVRENRGGPEAGFVVQPIHPRLPPMTYALVPEVRRELTGEADGQG